MSTLNKDSGLNENILPSERVKKNTRRRWSDSPTLLRDSNSRLDGAMSLSADHTVTQSLHDLSSSHMCPVSKSSSISQNNFLSTTTLQSERTSVSLTKSRDSGFNKSASCLSLNSASQKYSHVKSKVKKYVQDIKEAESLRRKSMSTDCVTTCVPLSADVEKPPSEVKLSRGDVNSMIHKMQSDLEDKNALIHALQGSYDDLLLKYAEAENKIDQLRIKSLHSSPNKSYRSGRFLSDPFDLSSRLHENRKLNFRAESSVNELPPDPLVCESPEGGLDDSVSFSFSDSNLLSPSPRCDPVNSGINQSHQKEVVISAPLRPIQKLYSTSVRLDKVHPSLGRLSPRSDISKSPAESRTSIQLPILTESKTEEKEESFADNSDDFEPNRYYITEDTGVSNNNLCHATTDTGIEDCVQSFTDKDTAAENEARKTSGRLSLGPELKRVLNIPGEDAISKVQRWQKSLPRNVTEPKTVTTPKIKRNRNRRPTSGNSVGVQTCVRPSTSRCSCNEPAHRSSDLIEIPDSPDLVDSAGNFDMTDCDNYFLELNRKYIRRNPKSPTCTRNCSAQPQLKTSGSGLKHLCCGECKTCGSAIVAPARSPREQTPSSASYHTPKPRMSHHKVKPGMEKTDKLWRDAVCSRKSLRCLKNGSSSNAYLTRAVLLDLLLNTQQQHSCCCCCQHTWRQRQSILSIPGEATQPGGRYSCEEGNSLQRCLDEIQKIATELKANLAASHAGLVNLSCRKR